MAQAVLEMFPEGKLAIGPAIQDGFYYDFDLPRPLTPEDLERTIETTMGELSLAQMLEAYVIWHINVHCGEISAIKGCQGLTGYPW